MFWFVTSRPFRRLRPASGMGLSLRPGQDRVGTPSPRAPGGIPLRNGELLRNIHPPLQRGSYRKARPSTDTCGLLQRIPAGRGWRSSEWPCLPPPLSPCRDFADWSSEGNENCRRSIAGPANATHNKRRSAAHLSVGASREPRRGTI